MNQLSRIYRYWVLLTGVFILLATIIVSGAIVLRTWQAERELLDGQRHLLERHLIGEYARICEEVYLKLDNWDARRKEMNDLLGNRASVAIAFDKQASAPAPRPGERPVLSWTTTTAGDDPELLVMPLFFADRYLGSLSAQIEWKAGWSIGGFGRVGVTVAVLGVALLAAWIIAFFVFRRSVFAPFMDQTLAMNRHAAIAEAVQMIAHDIRKPFASLRMCLATLRGTDDPLTIRRVVASSLPEVDALAAEVEGMLTEIMDSERPGRASSEPYALAEVLRACVEHEISAAPSRDELDVSYAVDDEAMVAVDSIQLRRIIGNIVRNAVEAMHGRGRIWVKARILNVHHALLCEVCIGNSGDPIPPADVPRLFDSYFTKGKDGGTGLGLAIAKKFVTAHGGTIRCQSSADRGTEFIFTLPATRDACLELALPEISADESPSEAGLGVLVVEDDSRYRAALMTMLAGLRDAGLVAHLSLYEASSSAEALQIADRVPLDLIVVAGGLGSPAHSGLDIVRELRRRGCRAMICLHSDGMTVPPNDLSDRADINIPKPLDTSKALRLLVSAASRASQG